VIAARNNLRKATSLSSMCGLPQPGRSDINARARNVVEHAACLQYCVSPSGQILASGSHDHSIRLWDSDRECVERLHGNPSEVWALTFTFDGQGIISVPKMGRFVMANERCLKGKTLRRQMDAD